MLRRLVTSPFWHDSCLRASSGIAGKSLFRAWWKRLYCTTASMATSTADGRRKVVVKMCSSIDGLDKLVQEAFLSSSLATDHELILQDLAQAPKEECEIVLADPSKVVSMLDAVPGLRWMQSTWAGVNALVGVQRRDFTCTRLAGCMGPQMAEYVMGAITSEFWFQIKQLQGQQRWHQEPFKKRARLNRMTLGCLGVGDLSSEIARLGQAYGMRTLGFASFQRDVSYFNEVTVDLAYVLAEANVIVNVLPSTNNTRGLLDGDALMACGESKLFINVGRGDIISEESLLNALEKGWLRRAVLDVFAPEPLAIASPLWKHPSVIITPHVSAISYPDDVARLFVENLSSYLEGKPLRFKVDLDKGY